MECAAASAFAAGDGYLALKRCVEVIGDLARAGVGLTRFDGQGR
ncbi:hypothetical protein H4W31_006646 [Plantactinospora soyae]|uniref:Uncharacterized protein n=1 Tax=Plantactinospora soyae TaxID=1544732 RepID=A0A927R2Q2_9ACTN|nr:hypothetical protein [Plantactinospora soyae]